MKINKIYTSLENATTVVSALDIRNAPIRRRGKKTRCFIDNEYTSGGYLAKLPGHVSKVYWVLTKYAHSKEQTCYPSLKTISDDAGVNRNYAAWSIRILEALHIITVRRKSNRVNNYTLIDNQMWRPVTSINVDTYKVVSKSNDARYQKPQKTSITVDTRSHRSKSTNEISIDKKEKDTKLSDWTKLVVETDLGIKISDEKFDELVDKAKNDKVPSWKHGSSGVLAKYYEK